MNNKVYVLSILVLCVALLSVVAAPLQAQDPTEAPETNELSGFEPVTTNSEWEPVIREFDGVEMVLVPVGCFMMGSESGGFFERPVHEVCFEEPYWIDQTEVTNGQFAAFNGKAERESHFAGDDRPREEITWTEASEFCASRDARLPTEAEWEYAARGPEGWVFPWGDEFVAENVVFGETSKGETAEVGSREDGMSWVGALDMSGNVWEWVGDWYTVIYYTTVGDSVVNPTGPVTGDSRVWRGGSWLDMKTDYLRAAFRWYGNPGSRNDGSGFRCARSVID